MKLTKKSTARQSQRYLRFRIISDRPVTFEDARNAATASILNWMGEQGAGLANVWVMKNLWDKEKQSGVIRCVPKAVDNIRFAMALVHQIGDSRAVFSVTKVSGTLKGLKG
jgi:RNase P/RNase MRP subunit POP5